MVSKEGQPLYLYKDYHAIVIGVSDYDYWPKLPNAVKDAKEVGARLEELGFKVNLITNPDSRKLKSTLTDIARRVGTAENRAILFYFTGHGETTELAVAADDAVAGDYQRQGIFCQGISHGSACSRAFKFLCQSGIGDYSAEFNGTTRS